MSNIRANHSAVQEKSQKARRYAREPDRFMLSEFQVTMKSDHGLRSIAYDRGTWSCTCDFFGTNRTCSHVMALDEIVAQQAQLSLEG
jgi:hypothetical protein